MRSYRAQHNLFAVSANNAETAINTVQTLDTTMLVAMGDICNLEPRRESNEDEANGYEEADTIYDLGATAGMTMNFERAQPQHFAFLMAYALGSVSTAAAGSGYAHTITPIANDLDASRSVPSFTGAQRLGATVLKRRFGSMFVDSLTATFARDNWCKISGAIKATGLVADNITEETIAALDNATSLTLAANGVQGSDAATRLDNVHSIKVNLSGDVWTDVTYTVVSAATPAVITIADPGGAGDSKNYKVLYIPTEAAWATFPARVTETPLRVSDMSLTVGGNWNGSAFSGGHAMNTELESIEWSFQNNLQVEFVPGGAGSYADRCFRDGRMQTLRLTRELRDYILQNYIDSNETFGIEILAEGAEYDSPHMYTVHLVFPKCAVISSPISVNGKRLAEAGDLRVLEDATYGSVWAQVKNLQATYAV